MKYLALDFGGTLVKYAVIDENANIFEENERPAPLNSVAEFTDTVTELYDLYKDTVSGIAISLPGFINTENGDAITAGSYFDLAGKNIFELLKNIPVPIAVENDGKCGALAELWTGSMVNVQNGAVLIIGTGLAGGIIINHKLYRGHQFSAGEYSYILNHPGEYSISNMIGMTGGMMSLEMMVAAAKGVDQNSLENAALINRDELKADVKTIADNDKVEKTAENISVNGRQIFKWVDENDPQVVPLYENFIKNLAWLIYTVQIVVDPEFFAIGGGVSRQPRLIEDIKTELGKIQPGIAVAKVPLVNVVPCKHLNHSNLYGAVYNYLIHNDKRFS